MSARRRSPDWESSALSASPAENRDQNFAAALRKRFSLRPVTGMIITNSSAQDVGPADNPFGACGESLQNLISGAVAIPIVDGFKVIEVEDRGAEREPILSRLAEKCAERGFEIAAIVQTGPGIGRRHFE